MSCAIWPPRPEDMLGFRPEGYEAECILENGHLGPHVLKTPEGGYIAWEEDTECGCEDCRSDDWGDHCVVYWEIQEADIPNLASRQV